MPMENQAPKVWEETQDGHYLVVDIQKKMIQQELGVLTPDITRPLPKDLLNKMHDHAGQLVLEDQKTCRWNMSLNKTQIRKSINSLKGSAKGKTAYIVGNGPSLKQNGHLLKEIRKGVVIAINGSTHIVKNPDYFFSIDFVGREHWVDCDLTKTTAILSPYVPPFIANGKFKDKRWFPFTVGREIIEDTRRLFPKFDTLQQGFSGTFPAVHFAYYLGCETIVFVGQDLAFTDGYMHSEDIEKTKFNAQWDYIPTVTLRGEVALTVSKFILTRNMIAGLCYWLLKAGIKVINATEDGILATPAFEGGKYQMEQITLQQAIDREEG